MGVLVAHTVVLVLDAAWVDSGFCASELATFRKNCKLARDFWRAPALFCTAPPRSPRPPCVCVEGAQRVAASSGCRRADAGADALPGSEFQLLVVYQQDMAAHELEQVRDALHGMTAEPATFYPAWFSKDEQFGLVGDGCECDGCRAEVHSAWLRLWPGPVACAVAAPAPSLSHSDSRTGNRRFVCAPSPARSAWPCGRSSGAK